MSGLAAIGDEHRPLHRGLFGAAGVLIEFPAVEGCDRHGCNPAKNQIVGKLLHSCSLFKAETAETAIARFGPAR
jgi:hypothetical protein